MHIQRAFEMKPEVFSVSSSINKLPDITFYLPHAWKHNSLIDLTQVFTALSRLPSDQYLFIDRVILISSKVLVTCTVLPIMISRISAFLTNDQIVQMLGKLHISYELSTKFKNAASNEDSWIDTTLNQGFKVTSQNLEMSKECTSGGQNEMSIFSSKLEMPNYCGGYEQSRFIETPPEDLSCPVCTLVIKKAFIMTCCEKTMCRACVKENNADDNAKYTCLACKRKTDSRVKNTIIEKQIKSLKVRCQHCPWIGKLEDFEKEHINKCPHKTAALTENTVNRFKPRIADVTSVGKVKLVWKKPDENSECVTHYSVSYCTSKTIARNQYVQYGPEGVTSESIVIDELQSDEIYYFKVNAHFNGSETTIVTSEPSDPVKLPNRIITGPPGAPTKLNATNEMITIEWSHPQCGHDNISHYKIIFRNCGKSDWNSRKIEKSSCIANIDKLVPSQSYEFKVIAIYSNGQKNESEIREIETTSSLPFPPSRPEIKKIENGMVRLAWSKPKQAFAKIEKYTLIWNSIYTSELSNIILTSNKEEIEFPIENIELGINYTFTLYAHAGQERSDPATNTICIDEKHVKPTCSGQPTVDVLTPTSALVNFEKPRNTLYVTKYTVCYCTVDEVHYNKYHEQEGEIEVDSEDSMSIKVQELAANEKYFFKIKVYYLKEKFIESEPSKLVELEDTVSGPPGKPFALQVTHNMIQIQWEEPHYKQQHVTKYQIYYKETEASNWSPEPLETNGNINFLRIHRLKSSQGYVVKVKAVCKNGLISKESHVSDEIQTDSIFSGPPGKPETSRCSTSSISINWTAPILSIEGGCTVKYEVHYSISGENDWKCCETDELSSKIDSLTSNTTYTIKIKAKLNAELEFSKFSETIEVKTLVPVSSKPNHLVASKFDSNEVILTWMKPTENYDQITGYVVEIQKEQETFSKQISKQSANTHEYTINELVPETTYKARVYAECHGEMRSPPSDELTFKTKCPMPGCSGVPELHSKKCNTIALKWKKPVTYSENVDSYTVNCYKLVANTQLEKIDMIQVNEDSRCTIKNLTPRTQYKFGVVVVSEERLSKEVFSDVIKTTAPTSGPVSLLSVDEITTSSVKLKWDPPKENADSALSYSFQYQKVHTDQPWMNLNDDISANATSYKVESLSQNTCYIFRVCVVCESGDKSDWQESMEITTSKTVSGPPGKPYSVSVQNHSINLQWNKPEHHDIFVQKYEVSCGSAATDKTIRKVATENNQIEITGLTSNTKYLFKVKTICENNYSSDFSECSDPIITTKPVLVIPEQPEAEETSCDSILVRWKEPVEGADAVENYMVCYSPSSSKQKSSSAWKREETNSKTPYYCIDGLEPCTSYTIKVKAKSKQYHEYGPESDSSTAIRTKPLPPGTPRLISRTHDSITLEWDAPKRKADQVDFYLINYTDDKRNNEMQTYQEEYSKKELKARIDGLKSGVEYQFQVMAVFKNNFVDLTKSEISECIRTKFPIPGPPGKPQQLNVTENSILIEWQKPVEHYEHIASYNVKIHCIEEGNASELSDIVDVPGKILDEKVEITGLRPNTQYEFKVEAVNQDGEVSMCVTSDPIRTEAAVPGPPGKPLVLQITSNAVQLGWEKPTKKSDLVSYYLVEHQLANEKECSQWFCTRTKSSQTKFEVHDLQPSTQYVFKVTPYTHDHVPGKNSEISEIVVTKSAVPSAPGKPKRETITATSVKLSWTRPQENFKNIAWYEVTYYQPDHEVETTTERAKNNEITITGLTPNKGYYFYVTAVTEANEKGDRSFLSDLITSDKSLAEQFLPQCTKLHDKSEIPVYLLPKAAEKGNSHGLKKVNVKQRSNTTTVNYKQRKVLMLVGATGSGKTTLINGMINYIMRAEFNDHFRLKLIHDENISQTESVTQYVTAYTIHAETGFALPYTLTIIDTPGFGDTRGIEHDKEITKQVREFFSTQNNDVSHLNGIGFVCQSGAVRLTPTQRYIFDSIFAMFGNDIKDNIFLLCTFCDDDTPRVIEAVEKEKIPVQNAYKFNSSALYTSKLNTMTKYFWETGVDSFRQFFSQFDMAKSVSLTLTKQVLDTRETLETIVIGVQEQIKNGMSSIKSLKQEIKILEKNKTEIENNKDFTYEVEEDITVKTDLESGKHVTNCFKCNMTCHYPCYIPNDDNKMHCAAMKQVSNEERKNVTCGVCPGHCHWSLHHNATYRFGTEKKKKQKVYAEKSRKYTQATNDKISVEKTIEGMKNELDDEFDKVFQLVKRANECTKKLDEIAFRPNALNDVEYIQLLIEAEKQEKKPGYLDRIDQYIVLKERAEVLAKTGEYKEEAEKGGKRWWENIF